VPAKTPQLIAVPGGTQVLCVAVYPEIPDGVLRL
jgi:hypothetical protein